MISLSLPLVRAGGIIVHGVHMSAYGRGWQETKPNEKKNISFLISIDFLKCFLPSRLIRLPLVSWCNVSVSSLCRWYRHWSWYRVRISKTTTLMWDEALSSETTLTPFNTVLKLAVSQGPLVPSNDITPIWSWVMALCSPCKLEERDKPVKDESERLTLFWLLSVPFCVPCSDSALLPQKGNGHSALKGWSIPFFTTCIQNINDLWKTNIMSGEKKSTDNLITQHSYRSLLMQHGELQKSKPAAWLYEMLDSVWHVTIQLDYN